MRVCTVSQRGPLNSSSEFFRLEITRSVFFPEVSADSVVILGRHLEGFEREFAPQCLPNVPLTIFPSLQEAVIIRRIGEDGDPLVILGCCTKKGNTSDIDFFDRICEGAPRFCDGFGEWVEVADHDRDGRN